MSKKKAQIGYAEFSMHDFATAMVLGTQGKSDADKELQKLCEENTKLQARVDMYSVKVGRLRRNLGVEMDKNEK